MFDVFHQYYWFLVIRILVKFHFSYDFNGNIFLYSRYAMQKISAEKQKREDDVDMHLAHKIMQNKQFKVSTSTQADDEYDFEDGQSKKSKKKQGGDDHKNIQKKMTGNRFLTQKERCLFCLENPNRPMHLVVSIANFTYLMLPQWQPVVPGHCCILPIQVSF